jgi:hypothetical protein
LPKFIELGKSVLSKICYALLIMELVFLLQPNIMAADYSGQDLKGKRFQSRDLENADFTGADIRGVDFSFSHLSGSRFVKAKTGITVLSKVLLFMITLVLSLASGYIAMLAGKTVQVLLKSSDILLRTSGYIITGFFLLFTIIAMWKGLFKTINTLLLAMIIITITMGLFMYLTGYGTGKGALYGTLGLLLMMVMFVVGTVARATVGTMGSTILFIIIALSGGVFAKSVGGGLATVIMSVACAVISKRALKGDSGNSFLKNIALRISSSFGTSFENADLTNADFTDAEIKNSNFSHAELRGVKWGKARGLFMLEDKDAYIHFSRDIMYPVMDHD